MTNGAVGGPVIGPIKVAAPVVRFKEYKREEIGEPPVALINAAPVTGWIDRPEALSPAVRPVTAAIGVNAPVVVLIVPRVDGGVPPDAVTPNSVVAV
jgi:hypothetical protein